MSYVHEESDREKLIQIMASLKQELTKGFDSKDELEKAQAYYDACEWALRYEEKRGAI